MTTADIPKVRVRDEKGRIVISEGYYFEYPRYMGPGLYDGEPPPPPPIVRGVMIYDQGDWNMANTPRFFLITPPHTIEVIESPAPATRLSISGNSAGK